MRRYFECVDCSCRPWPPRPSVAPVLAQTPPAARRPRHRPAGARRRSAAASAAGAARPERVGHRRQPFGRQLQRQAQRGVDRPRASSGRSPARSSTTARTSSRSRPTSSIDMNGHQHPEREPRQAPAQRRLLRRRQPPDADVQVQARRAGRRRQVQAGRRPDDPRQHEGSRRSTSKARRRSSRRAGRNGGVNVLTGATATHEDQPQGIRRALEQPDRDDAGRRRRSAPSRSTSNCAATRPRQVVLPDLACRIMAAGVEPASVTIAAHAQPALSAHPPRRHDRPARRLRPTSPTTWPPGGWRSRRCSLGDPDPARDLPPLPAHAARLHADLRPRLHPDARRALHLRARAARVLGPGPLRLRAEPLRSARPPRAGLHPGDDRARDPAAADAAHPRRLAVLHRLLRLPGDQRRATSSSSGGRRSSAARARPSSWARRGTSGTPSGTC